MSPFALNRTLETLFNNSQQIPHTSSSVSKGLKALISDAVLSIKHPIRRESPLWWSGPKQNGQSCRLTQLDDHEYMIKHDQTTQWIFMKVWWGFASLYLLSAPSRLQAAPSVIQHLARCCFADMQSWLWFARTTCAIFQVHWVSAWFQDAWKTNTCQLISLKNFVNAGMKTCWVHIAVFSKRPTYTSILN